MSSSGRHEAAPHDGAKPMSTPDEHEDDLEPEVIEGVEIETEEYPEDEDQEQSPQGTDVTNPIGRADQEGPSTADVDNEDQDGDASDTI